MRIPHVSNDRMIAFRLFSYRASVVVRAREDRSLLIGSASRFELLATGGTLRLGRAIQRCPGSERVHIVSPMDDFSVLNRDDRDEPIVIGCVLVQPEMERERFPLVSNPPFRARSL
jgi:hypothetical protein